MKIVIFGATGLIGQGVLLQALDHPEVEHILSVGRRTLALEHPKLRQIVHHDFNDFQSIASAFQGADACFWCLGTASAGMDEATYTHVTYTFTMAAAKELLKQSPEVCFCFVSGAGTDETEHGWQMWARVKGKTENALRRLDFHRLYLFRPGVIQPMRGYKRRSPLAQAAFAPVYALLRAFGGATSNTNIGDAMLAAALGQSDRQILSSNDINRLAQAA